MEDVASMMSHKPSEYWAVNQMWNKQQKLETPTSCLTKMCFTKTEVHKAPTCIIIWTDGKNVQHFKAL